MLILNPSLDVDMEENSIITFSWCTSSIVRSRSISFR